MSRPNKWQAHLSKPRFEFGGVFLCVGRKRLHRCLSEAAAIYIVSRRNEDNLLKKSLRMRGTLIPQKQVSNLYIIEVIYLISA